MSPNLSFDLRRIPCGKRWAIPMIAAALAWPPAQAEHPKQGTGPFGSFTNPSAHWGYQGDHGPAHWGELAPEFSTCSEGRNQSPINIQLNRHARLAPLGFHYRTNVLSVRNTGSTIQVNYSSGSFLRVDGHRYELKHIHFHAPSEHQIHGVSADMSAHLVHEDGAGNLAVVAVPFKVGRRHNSILGKIWRHLPERPGDLFYDRQTGINATFMLPPDRSYFTYEGSLTTPPCTEGVRWIVLQNPVEVDAGFVERFHRVIGSNVRPVQPLNDRQVVSSKRS